MAIALPPITWSITNLPFKIGEDIVLEEDFL